MPNSLQPPRPTLRDLTPARVALATTGHSLTTTEILTFELAQARARDAVHTPLNLQAFTHRLQTELEDPPPILQLRSNAPTRAAYLRQPNLGRTLHPESRALLKPEHPSDLAIILADGLSAQALERHAIPVLTHLLPLLREAAWTLAPLSVVQHARVALADPIGQALQARCTLILLGERPGLTSPDSLGAYLTWSPNPHPHRRRPQLPLEHPRHRPHPRTSRPTPLRLPSASPNPRTHRHNPERRQPSPPVARAGQREDRAKLNTAQGASHPLPSSTIPSSICKS